MRGEREENCLVTSAATTRIGSPEYEPLISVAVESPLEYAIPDLDIRAPLCEDDVAGSLIESPARPRDWYPPETYVPLLLAYDCWVYCDVE